MKNLFKYMFAAALSAAAMTACSTDATDEVVTPEVEGKSFKVVASFDDTRATIDDISALQWAVGDQLDARQFTTGGGSHEYRSTALTAEGIVDGHATFEFGHLITDNPAYFMYGLSGGAVWKSEFNFQTNMTQAAAGTMNKDYLKLLSDPVKIATVGANSYEAKMGIVGTVLRFIIYSGTGARAEEKVQSVQMVSTETNLFGLIAYDFQLDGLYWKDGNVQGQVSENCEIFYSHAKSATVTLTEPMLLDTKDAASSQGKGIYLPVPPIAITGYKYVVTTDQAVYTFDASTKATTFADNTLKNVMLDVEKGARLGANDFKGYIYYEGGPGDATVDAVAGSLNSIGYTVARVSDPNGENWNMSTEQVGRDEYLYNATYVYYDENDKVIAPEDSWLTVDFSPLNICHWRLTYGENTAATPRAIKVVGTLVDPEGYTIVTGAADLTPKTYTYTFTVTQKANLVVEAQLSETYAETIPANGGEITAGKLALTVNGVATDVATAMSQYGVTVEVAGATKVEVNDAMIKVTIPENPYNVAKTYVLNVKFDGKVIETLDINQAAGTQEMPYLYDYTFGTWSGDKGKTYEYNMPVSGKVPSAETWLVLFNSVTLKSGVALSEVNLDLFVNQVFGGEQAQYDWLYFDVEGPLNDLRIRAGIEPNTTGERRTATLYTYESDGLGGWWRKIVINQDAQ